MSVKLGMNVEQVRQLARYLEQQAQKLEREIKAITSKVKGVDWQGPDREKFLADWDQHTTQLANTCNMLRDAARTMRIQADEQEQASSR